VKLASPKLGCAQPHEVEPRFGTAFPDHQPRTSPTGLAAVPLKSTRHLSRLHDGVLRTYKTVDYCRQSSSLLQILRKAPLSLNVGVSHHEQEVQTAVHFSPSWSLRTAPCGKAITDNDRLEHEKLSTLVKKTHGPCTENQQVGGRQQKTLNPFNRAATLRNRFALQSHMQLC